MGDINYIIDLLRRPSWTTLHCRSWYSRGPKGKKLLGRLWRKWKNNIKVYFKETGWNGMDWIPVADKFPVVGSCEHINKLQHSIKGRECVD
jgi:hypothetical protein